MNASLPPWQWFHQGGILVRSLLLLLPLLILAVARRRSRAASTWGRRLPPSPPKLPLIGNLHQLGSSSPHRSLAALSRVHGPLMLLQLGQVPTLVVSSAHAAEQILKTHDAVFANRPPMDVPKKLLYGCVDLVLSPYGEYWRKLRKTLSIHLLGTRTVQSYKLVREEEEVALMIHQIERLSSESSVVDLTGILEDFVNDLILRVAHGRGFRDEGLNRAFHEVMEENVFLFSKFPVGDYFPSLRWLSVFTGLESAPLPIEV